MNIAMVKQLREETKMPVRICVETLEGVSWNFDEAKRKLITSPFSSTTKFPTVDRSPITVFDELSGRIDVLFFDKEGRMLYRKGNVIEGIWDPTIEFIVDLPKVGLLEDL